MTRIGIIGAAVASLSATATFAQAPAGPSDGSVTRAQLKQMIEQRFAERDANHDGVLTVNELPGRDATAMMQRLDTDHDGKITLAELGAKEMAAFDAADTDHDGVLTSEERAAAAKARKQH